MSVDTPRRAQDASPSGRLGPGRHFCIAAFWFATNLLWGAVLIIIVPRQMESVYPKDPAWMAGLVLGIGAIAALVVPMVVGQLSDRSMSRWGRRRPYMVVGVIVNLVGLAMVWQAGATLNLWLYFVGYFIANAGNNIATGAYMGVIPDVVPEEQRGEASGWMAALSQLGTVLGVFSAGRLMDTGHVGLSFVVTSISLVAFLLVTVIGVKETPRQAPPGPLTWSQFIKRFWIDPRKYPDYGWVWLTRALVVMGQYTVQEFMVYYVKDVQHVPADRAATLASYLLGTGLICACVTGLLGGLISDRVGRKRVVYVANVSIALMCVAFIFVPTLAWAFIAVAVFGLGYGAYYSVDFALGCDVLPNREDAAKDMGVWHIAFVLPQSIALPIAGGVLSLFGHAASTASATSHQYGFYGYVALFGLAAFYMLLGALLLRNVKGVR